MALNPNFMISPNLQEYFVDKSSGLPLTGGEVFYYKDESRSDLKTVYTLSGTAGSYSYTALPNPVPLSGVGTTSDGAGNDIRVYYHPYNAAGEIELYYIVVKDANGVTQLTRQAWPNLVSGENSDVTPPVNYVSNGQFLTHTTPPPNFTAPSTQTVIGQIPATQPITYIAQGGWTFERPNPSDATDFVTFVTNVSPLTVLPSPPQQAPRNVVNVLNTVPGTDSFKYIAVKWPDVAKFSTDANLPSTGQTFTLSFVAKATFTTAINIIIKQFFGAGGSITTTKTIGDPFTLGTSYEIQHITFTFDSTAGKVIGTGGDDYVQIIFSLPSGVAMNVSLTDVLLTLGNQPNVTFPVTTDAEFLSLSLVPPTPDPLGNDLLCPLVLTRTGLAFDHSTIGSVMGSYTQVTSNADHPSGYLLADGSSFLAANYDPIDGIPYARLQAKWLNTSVSPTNIPLFGTGFNYVTAYQQLITAVTNSLRLTANLAGTMTAFATDGAIPTGFTFAPSIVNIQGSTGYSVYMHNNILSLEGLAIGASLSPLIDVVGSGIVISSNPLKNNSTTYVQLEFTLVSVPTGTGPGNYIRLSNPTQTWLIWFNIDGAGTAPGGTLVIEVLIKSTYTVSECNAAMMSAMMGCQGSTILTSVSPPPAGSYFTFYTPTTATPASQLFVVWYQVNGSGTQPVVSNAQFIKVTLTGSPTPTQVAQATQLAINSVYLALPDLRGLFLRGYDPTIQWDYDQFRAYIYAYGTNPALGGIELDSFASHSHTIFALADTGGQVQAGDPIGGLIESTSLTGYNETVPVNSAVNWLIKY